MPVRITASALSDPGQVRKQNEDYVLLEAPPSPRARQYGTLCVVADGVGGQPAGEVASALAAETVMAEYYRRSARGEQGALLSAIEAANAAVLRGVGRADSQEGIRKVQFPSGSRPSLAETAGMATTLTAAVVREGRLEIGHVGDTRAYLLRGEELAQLTQDHSWVAEMARQGVLGAAEAGEDPRRNVLTRAIGRAESVEVDLIEQEAIPGDVIVLCSDGLTATVTQEELGQAVKGLPPDLAVRRLIDLANERGAPDNVSVAIVMLSEESPPTRPF